MTKKKHPSNRYERMQLEKKYEEKRPKTGRVRKVRVKEFAEEETYDAEHEAGDFPVQRGGKYDASVARDHQD